MVPEQTGALDAEATGGIAGRNIEHRGAPTPLLPLDRQNMQEAGGVTPLRKVANGHGGLRVPESQFTSEGDTSSSPHFYGCSDLSGSQLVISYLATSHSNAGVM